MEGYGVRPRTKNGPAARRLWRGDDEGRAAADDHHAARAAAPVADLGSRQGALRSTRSSRSRPASRSSSPTPTARGSAARTRTPTACCASTSPRAPTCRAGARRHRGRRHALNTRPRKTLGWKTPAEAFDEQLRSLQPPGVASTVESGQYCSAEFDRYCKKRKICAASGEPGCAGTTPPPRSSSPHEERDISPLPVSDQKARAVRGRGLHRSVLQPETTSFHAGLPHAGEALTITRPTSGLKTPEALSEILDTAQLHGCSRVGLRGRATSARTTRRRERRYAGPIPGIK